MKEDAYAVLLDVARKRIGDTTVGELPMPPLDLSDVVLLTMCNGEYSAIAQAIITVATEEFGLVNTEKGIDLPPQVKLSPNTKLEVQYQDPSYYVGIPEVPPYRVTRRGKVDPHKGQD